MRFVLRWYRCWLRVWTPIEFAFGFLRPHCCVRHETASAHHDGDDSIIESTTSIAQQCGAHITIITVQIIPCSIADWVACRWPAARVCRAMKLSYSSMLFYIFFTIAGMRMLRANVTNVHIKRNESIQLERRINMFYLFRWWQWYNLMNSDWRSITQSPYKYANNIKREHGGDICAWTNLRVGFSVLSPVAVWWLEN